MKINFGRIVFALRMPLVLFGLVASTAVAHADIAATPVFNLAAGTYTSTQTVTITSTTPGASIRYTTDGSIPSETNGTLYSGIPANISSTTFLKAIAYGNGSSDSPVASGFYTILSSSAASLNVLYNFEGSSDGSNPLAALVPGSDGNFYGTASGLYYGDGTAFKITPAGVFTTLVSLPFPYGGLVQGSDSNFYGTTMNGGSGGYGTVFQMTPAGALTTLVSFDGANGFGPPVGLVQDSDGNFYGTTQNGGSAGYGTVFKMTPAGVLTTLVSFDGANGDAPMAALVQGSDGNFYGTTSGQDLAINGTIFKITPAGVLTTLLSSPDIGGGVFTQASLVQGSDGNIYGTSLGGGNSGVGTVFQITPAGVFTTLASFDRTNGSVPYDLVQGSDGNFYGTTINGGSGGYGTVFQMTPAGALTTLVSFDGANGHGGDNIGASLVQGSDGNFYGTAPDGGFGYGVIFQLVIPRAVAPVFSLSSGTYTGAQTVTISTPPGSPSIRYTTDGSTPGETNGTLLSNGGSVSLPITTTTTLKAIAYEPGYTNSPVVTAVYTFPAPIPTILQIQGSQGYRQPADRR